MQKQVKVQIIFCLIDEKYKYFLVNQVYKNYIVNDYKDIH